MKQRIYNGHSLDFFDSSNNHKAEIKLSGSQFVINPLGSGTVNISSSLTQGGELIFRHNNTGITMKDSSNVSTRVFRLNSGNTMYIGPIDAYAGGGIIYGAATAVTSHAFYVGGASKLAVQAATSTFASNLNVFPNAGTGTFRVGRYAGQEFKLHATDLINTLTSINDADENQTHEFILNRVHAGTGADNFKIQKDGSNQLTIDKNGLVTIPGSLTVTGTTTTVNSTNLDLSDNIIGLNRGASSNANDSGLIIERGSTGDNAAFLWDESADRFIFGTTAATASDTGNVSYTYAPFSSNALWTDSSAIAHWGNANTAYGTLTWDTGFASIYATAGKRLRIGAHGSQGVMVVSSSLVGIGTETPNSKLDVRRAGSGVALELIQTSGNANDFIDLKMIAGNTTAGTLGTILRHKRDGSGGGDFSILTNPTLSGTPTEKLIVKSGGNVGIGTTDPDANLEVVGTTVTSTVSDGVNAVLIGLAGSNRTTIQFDTADTTHTNRQWGLTNIAGDFYIGRHGLNVMTMKNNGNVGIGYANPSDFTSVNADNLVVGPLSGNNGITVNSATSGYGALAFADGTGASDQYRGLIQYNHTTNSLALFTNASTKMTILSDGNVGINTTLPFEKLDVNGNIYAQDRVINANVTNANPNLLNQASIKISNKNDIYGNLTIVAISPYEAAYTSDGTGASTIRLSSETALTPGAIHTFSVYYKDLVGSLNIDLYDVGPSGSYTTATGTASAPASGRLYGYAQKASTGAGANYNFVDINLANNGSVTLLNPKLETGKVVTEFIATTEAEGIPQTITTNNLRATGSIQMGADDTTATADKVGTMRYRTGTEYVEVDGVELVTNGNFDSATGWNLNSNWSISGGTCNADGTSNNDINQNQNVGVVGQKYRITYVISAYTQGSISARIGSGITALNTGTGTFTQVVTATTTDRIRMNIASSFIGSVDSLSIVKVTAEDSSYADMCMQTALTTYEWVNIVRNTY